MSDPKKMSLGRGRGRSEPGTPWNRSKSYETNKVVRRPKNSTDVKTVNKEFTFSPQSFPPLTPETDAKPVNNDSLESESPNIKQAKEKDRVKYSTEKSIKENSTENDEKCKMSTEEQGTTLSGHLQQNNVNLQEIVFNESQESITKSAEDVAVNNDDQKLNKVLPSSYIINTDINSNETIESNLSPYASEFYPKNLERVAIANEFVTGNLTNSNEYMNDFVPNNVANIAEDRNVVDLERLQLEGAVSELDTRELIADVEETLAFIYTNLTENPGSFDKVMEVVTPHFVENYLKKQDLSKKIIDELYAYAMIDESYAFFAVKILTHLMNVDLAMNSTSFRTFILHKARDEVMTTLQKRLVQGEENQACGSLAAFLRFISELYLQLEVGKHRLDVIGTAIGEILEALLGADHIPIKERLGDIKNTVKLTGKFLDQDNKYILDRFVEFLRAKLDEEYHNLEFATRQSVESLIALRNSDWGDKVIEMQEEKCVEGYAPPYPVMNNPIRNEVTYDIYPPMPIHQPQMAYPAAQEFVLPNQSNVAVFYGPDGQVLSNDELLFLESNTDQQIQDHLPDGMDGEMHEAYLEFLQAQQLKGGL